MLAVTATAINPSAPLEGLTAGEHPDPESDPARPGWTTVTVKSAALNHHDIWTLRGAGMTEDRLPIVLGCDAAGTTEDGREVIVHAVISAPGAEEKFGSELLDPKMSLLSELYDGTLAERLAVPEANLIDKPAELSFEEAACLPTAYLTAYRALFTHGGCQDGDPVLVQGAGGGFANACILLGKARGLEVHVTSRSEERRAHALELGADGAHEPGARLPVRVRAVMESVGEATWDHSLKSLAPGGVVVVIGGTSGLSPKLELPRLFMRALRVQGSAMGTRQELQELADLLVETGVRPLIDSVRPLSEAAGAFARMETGELFGKLVLNT